MKLNEMMTKIVHISGSPHAAIGNTYALVKQYVEALEDKGTKVELINHFLVKEHVEECRGCTRCMRRGDCVMATKDDVSKIVEDLLSADFIIFSSPVYVLNVTGLMKKFFDRTAFMTHRIVLEDKIGMFVLSSQGLGTENVQSYMQSVMEAMGISILGNVCGVAIFHNQFINQDEIQTNIDKVINLLETDEYMGKIKFSDNEKMRREKFAFLMDQNEISQKLFREDAKYWTNRKKVQFL